MLTSQVPPPTINLLESDEDAEPSHFANSGPPRRRSVSPLIPKPTKDVVGSSPSIRLTASSPHPILPPASASTRKRVSTKPDATPRLRHDNSQIQFAAIESSPVRETQDTQHLTENQREVKERQQEEAAAMFADLRSSPRLKKKSGILNLSSDLPDSVARSYNRPGTPTANLLAPLPGDNFIASSPTPQSRRKESQAAVLSDDEGLLIPSSPPRGRSRTPSPRAGPLTENTDAAASSKSSALHGDSSDASNTSMQQRYAGPAGSITLTAPYMRNAEQDKPDLSIEASGVQEMENNPDPTKKDGQKRKTSLSRNSSTKSEGALANITSSQQVQSSSNRKKSKKTQSERTESRPRTSDLPEKAASERPRSRSSSLSELDEEMVLSLRPPKKRSTKVVPEDNGESRPVGNEYFLLGADETFVPEEYTWIEPSPQRSPEHPSAQQRLSAKKSNFKDDTEAIGKPKATRSSERRKSQPQTDGQESFLPQSSQQNTSARSSRTPAEKSSAATATERKRKKTTQIGSDEVPARSSSVATERSRKRRKAKDTLVVVDSQQQPPASTVAEDVVTVPPMSQSSRRNRSRVDSETPSAEAQPQQKKQRLSKAEKRKRSKSRSASVATADRSEIENSQPTVLDPKESLDFPPPPKEDDVPACLSPVQEEPESGNVPKHVNAKESIDFGKPTEDETLTSSMTSSRDTENGCAEESEDAQMLDAQLSPRRESFAEQSIAEVIQTAKVATPAADSPDLDMVDIEEQIRLETSMSQSQSQSWPHSSSSAVNEPIPDQGLAQLPSYADPSSTVANTTGPVKEEQSSPTHQLSGKELGADIMERFKKIMDDLPKASLTRGEATVIEGMIWDMKAELYQAELRGRK